MIPSELPKPSNDDDFERMCADVYADVFETRRVQKFGRRGQDQGGLDIIVRVKMGIIGVQAKRYNSKKFTKATVKDEITKADNLDLEIKELVVATTAPNDVAITCWIEKISLARQQAGLFKVTVDFWDDITAHIRRSQNLSRKYDLRLASDVINEDLYREKDIRNLTKIFSALNINIIELHIRKFPYEYYLSVAQLFDVFFKTVNGVAIIFHDLNLKVLVDDFAGKWIAAMPQDGKHFFEDTSVSGVERYQSTGAQHRLGTNRTAPIAFKEYKKSINEFAISFRALLDYVNVKFPMVDVEELGTPVGLEIMGDAAE